jgi:hypothetical protein
MSSDEIIREIIRGVVTDATKVLKMRSGAEPERPTYEVEGQSQIRQLFQKSTAPLPYQVTETLAAFMVRAVVLDPNNDFQIESELSRDHVDRLINLCVDHITAMNDPVIETVRIQVYFDTNFPSQSSTD